MWAKMWPRKSVAWAEEHLFERRSVVHEHELWRHALEHARGREVAIADIQAVTNRRNYLRIEDQPGKVTTREHLMREWEIVQTAKEGFGDCHPLVWNPRPVNPQLDEEQRQALECIGFQHQPGVDFSRWRWHGQKFCPA